MVAKRTVVSIKTGYLQSADARFRHGASPFEGRVRTRVAGNTPVFGESEEMPGQIPPENGVDTVDYRLRKHADYQRVYREGRKQFSSSMSYFFALRTATAQGLHGPRVGLTAGKVLGKAVERNRIKRRMRDIVRRRIPIVKADVDIVLHPRRSVLSADFAKLESEVERIFTTIQAAISRRTETKSPHSEARS